MKRFLIILLAIPIITLSQEKDKNIWEPFKYFAGSWEGHETGKAGIGKGDRTYEFIMDDVYLFQKNTSKFEPQEKNPDGEVHVDWTFFSYDKFRKKYVLREFHIESFVNQYTLDSLSHDNKHFVFVSESLENAPKGMRARVKLTIENENEFLETFELAFPGKDYSEFLRNHWKRKM